MDFSRSDVACELYANSLAYRIQNGSEAEVKFSNYRKMAIL